MSAWEHAAFWAVLIAPCLVQVLASFLVQDLEAEGLNPFLLTYIANSLFMIYLPAYALAKRIASRRLKGRQALFGPHSCCLATSSMICMPSLSCALYLHSVSVSRPRFQLHLAQTGVNLIASL